MISEKLGPSDVLSSSYAHFFRPRSNFVNPLKPWSNDSTVPISRD